MNIKNNYSFFLIIFCAALVALSFLFVIKSFNKDTEKFASSLETTLQALHKNNFISGELLLKFKEGISVKDQEEIIKNTNIKVKSEIPQIKVKVISVPEAAQDEVARALANNPKVEFVENNYLAEAVLIPNDPNYPSQWHHPKISSPSGWDINTGSKDIIIAIADTGVDPTHPDLAAKLVPGYNFYNNNTDTHDVYGHGTAVAGSAAAISDNSIGVTGVAWNNLIMPLRIADPTGWATYSAMASAMTYAADHGAKVVNLSYAGTGYSSTLQSAANYAWSKGLIIVASAGNYSTSVLYYPAALNNVLAISATASSDAIASFSNYGTWVDLAAPGVSILTTTNGGGYGSWSGTSFSAPITAGLAALVFSANPSLKNTDVVNLMETNADDLGTSGFDVYYGWGRINVAKTLAAATSIVPASDTASPSVSITSPANGSIISGTISVAVSATDNVGVTKVEFWKDSSLFASTLNSPYSFIWDTTKDLNGSHSLISKAYDAAGNIGTSPTITVNVNNVPDAISPTVSINQPANNSTLPKKGTVSISVSANDNIGVTQIQIFFDGSIAISCFQNNVCTYRLNTNKLASGTHSIDAKAYDVAGNMGSAGITVIK